MSNNILELDYRIMGKDIRSYTPHNDISIEIIQTWSEGGHFLIKNRVFPINVGNVFIINGIETHSSNPSDAQQYVRSKIILSYPFFEEFIQIAGLVANPQIQQLFETGCVVYTPSTEEAYDIDRLFQSFLKTKNSSEPFTDSKLLIDLTYLMISVLSIKNNDDSALTKPDYMLKKITDYIDNTLKQHHAFSLDEMCKNLYVSKSYACHLFKKTSGLSIGQYVTNLKITEAKKLLIHTDMKVNKIATILGFTDVPGFCRLFKKNANYTPLEYRKKHRSIA